jgi:hypothetical protein
MGDIILGGPSMLLCSNPWQPKSNTQNVTTGPNRCCKGLRTCANVLALSTWLFFFRGVS